MNVAAVLALPHLLKQALLMQWHQQTPWPALMMLCRPGAATLLCRETPCTSRSQSPVFGPHALGTFPPPADAPPREHCVLMSARGGQAFPSARRAGGQCVGPAATAPAPFAEAANMFVSASDTNEGCDFAGAPCVTGNAAHLSRHNCLAGDAIAPISSTLGPTSLTKRRTSLRKKPTPCPAPWRDPDDAHKPLAMPGRSLRDAVRRQHTHKRRSPRRRGPVKPRESQL